MITKKKVTVNYVDNKKFHEEIVKHKEKEALAEEQGLPRPKLSNYIGECIYKIATNFARKPSYMNYSYKEEMIADGIENCIKYFDGYNHEKYQNPFAYFSQVVYHAYLRRIYAEEKIRYALYKNFQENIVGMDGVDSFVDSDDNPILPKQLYDNITQFMKDFEEKEARKKAKRKAAKENLTKFLED